MTIRAGQGERHPAASAPRRSSFAVLLALAVCAALAFTGFVALGTWQVQRLHWKQALIARIEARVHAAPMPAPGPERWPGISAESDEYRRVRVAGTFLYELSSLVQASTALGSGYWVMTPLRVADGSIVLINRGFIPAGAAGRVRNGAAQTVSEAGAAAGPGVSTVTGLLRISEPDGAFLRRNDPSADRWYSRDVQAIAVARGLSRVAPYFVDAGAEKKAAGGPALEGAFADPVGGLTVITFHNNHLIYVLTWYALALMVAGAGLWVVREERKMRCGNAIHVESNDQGIQDGGEH